MYACFARSHKQFTPRNTSQLALALIESQTELVTQEPAFGFMANAWSLSTNTTKALPHGQNSPQGEWAKGSVWQKPMWSQTHTPLGILL